LSPRISTLSSQDRYACLFQSRYRTRPAIQPWHTIPYRTRYTHIIPYHTMPCHVICQIISLSSRDYKKKQLTTISHLPLRCPFILSLFLHPVISFPLRHTFPSSSPLFLGPSPFRMPLWPRPKNSLSSFFIQTAIASRCRSRFVNFNCFRPLRL